MQIPCVPALGCEINMTTHDPTLLHISFSPVFGVGKR